MYLSPEPFDDLSSIAQPFPSFFLSASSSLIGRSLVPSFLPASHCSPLPASTAFFPPQLLPPSFPSRWPSTFSVLPSAAVPQPIAALPSPPPTPLFIHSSPLSPTCSLVSCPIRVFATPPSNPSPVTSASTLPSLWLGI
ncbi:hypothetical protein Naga_100438g4 [Nannochloropsis gaditana]|uniref:Uncharacterized protein n=1 Tax=Nannochloropsis gaditana TaxID=72520 RepID=W7TMS4_9STRA|nr:hypothetical protein Naga_100438g4 [Nannochloropsis gaditana]